MLNFKQTKILVMKLFGTLYQTVKREATTNRTVRKKRNLVQRCVRMVLLFLNPKTQTSSVLARKLPTKIDLLIKTKRES